MERLGRFDHPEHGKGVRVKVRSWEGPLRAGDRGREVFTEYYFPRNQFNHFMHPKHPTGYDTNGMRCSFSPSLSYYKDLCAYGQFQWREPKLSIEGNA